MGDQWPVAKLTTDQRLIRFKGRTIHIDADSSNHGLQTAASRQKLEAARLRVHTQALLGAKARSAADALVPTAGMMERRSQVGIICSHEAGLFMMTLARSATSRCQAHKPMPFESQHEAAPGDVAAYRAELARAGCCRWPNGRRQV
jgi:hypothetical protein